MATKEAYEKKLEAQLKDLHDVAPTEKRKRALIDQLKAAKSLEASLLIPVIHGVVALPKPGGGSDEDRTLDRDVALVNEDGKPAPNARIFDTKNQGAAGDASREKLQGQLPGEHRSVWQYLIVQREAVEYDSKSHYRIVYGEVCKPLYKVDYLHSIYFHLAKVAKGNTSPLLLYPHC